MWRLIVEKEKGFGRARQLPPQSWIEFVSLLAILRLIVREEGNSGLEPLKLRYMKQG
jgi:hypothetical protein